jgi:hypothetical protein
MIHPHEITYNPPLNHYKPSDTASFKPFPEPGKHTPFTVKNQKQLAF